MGLSYVRPKKDDPVWDVIREAKELWHDALCTHDVRIGVLWVSDKNGQPCLKRRGSIFAAATIQKIDVKYRHTGAPDALLLIDAANWAKIKADERLALVDHELHHLMVEETEGGDAKLDGAERPVLHMREHDFEIGGFFVIMDRHGKAAGERKLAEFVVERARQLPLAFDDPASAAARLTEEVISTIDRIEELAERKAIEESEAIEEPIAALKVIDPDDPPGQPPGLIGAPGVMGDLDALRTKTLARAAEVYGEDSLTVDALTTPRGTWEALNACAKAMDRDPVTPHWDHWSEFYVELGGDLPSALCLFDPTAGDHGVLEIHGPITSTGYHSVHGADLKKDGNSLLNFATNEAKSALRGLKASEEKTRKAREKHTKAKDQARMREVLA